MLRARFCLFRARRTRTQFQTIKFQSKNYSHPSPLTFKAPSPFESTPETEQQKRAKLTTKTYHPDLSENSVQKYGRFWRKFLDDAALLHKVESGDEQAFQDLVESLAQVHPNLDLEINRDPSIPFVKSTITISASGETEFFPIVLGLVEKSPTKQLLDKGWKAIAFKQRKRAEPEDGIQMGSISVKFEDIEFVAFPPEDGENEKRLSLQLRVKQGTQDISGHIEDIILVMLSSIVGEYQFSQYIGKISFVIDFDESEKQNIANVLDLPSTLDSYLS